MQKMSLSERMEIIAKNFGFVEDEYYTSIENMNKKNVVCSIMRI